MNSTILGRAGPVQVFPTLLNLWVMFKFRERVMGAKHSDCYGGIANNSMAAIGRGRNRFLLWGKYNLISASPTPQKIFFPAQSQEVVAKPGNM